MPEILKLDPNMHPLGPIQSFELFYGACVAVTVWIRLAYRKRFPGAMPRMEASEWPALLGTAAGMLVLPLLHATSWLPTRSYYLLPTRLGWIGCLLMCMAVLLIWRAHHDLGPQWTPTSHPIHEAKLVTKGIYGIIRHPMYAAHMLWALAQPLLIWNWIAGLGFLFAWMFFYRRRVAMEETNLRNFFGNQYQEYAQRVPRIIPRFGSQPRVGPTNRP